MKLSLTSEDLIDYLCRQLNFFFPDNQTVKKSDLRIAIDATLNRIESCFANVSLARYCDNNQAYLNHLYSDHYLHFLWNLSNVLWKMQADPSLLNKLYYLNKSLHGFDCLFDTELPETFLIFHGGGIVLGKAVYGNYFVAFQGCTVGSHNKKYPRIGNGVTLAANSSVIGESNIGNRVSVGSATNVFKLDVPEDHSVYRNQNGKLVIKLSQYCFAQSFFKTSISS